MAVTALPSAMPSSSTASIVTDATSRVPFDPEGRLRHWAGLSPAAGGPGSADAMDRALCGDR